MRDIRNFENKIIHGDMFDVMKDMPDNSVDMAFIDPPYNLKKSYSTYNDEQKDQEYIKWCNDWLSECMRVLKTTGSLFVINIPMWAVYHAHHLNNIALFKHWIAWDALGSPTKSRLLPSHYGILWYTKTDNIKHHTIRIPHVRDRKGELLADWGGKKDMLHPYGKVASDIWGDIHRIRHKVKRDSHPCQLPPHLIERMILSTTDEGDIVLDPMVGTGTTAVAAKRMGRKYIGIDIDDEYVKIAKKNVGGSTPTRVGGKYVSVHLKKVITMRNQDFEEIDPFLKKIDMKVTSQRTKEMSLPKLKRNVELS